jgi:hypothetical protein
MKRYLYTLIFVLTAALQSCSLEEDMTSRPTRKDSYDTADQCKAVLNSCYDNFNAFITTNFALMVEACTDLWHVDSNTPDAFCNISPAQPGCGMNLWTYCYRGVMRANECIECISNAPIADEDKLPLVAEARVLRAMYYYYLTNTFNGVPYYTCMVKDDKTMQEIGKLGRTPANDIRDSLYVDLEKNAIPVFEKYGLDIKTSDDPENRARYATGLMMMAKFAMWRGEWDRALTPLKKLESLYGDLSTYPLEETDWSIKNTAESIFEIQHAYSTTGIQYYSSLGRLYYPAIEGDGWYDGVYMPQWGTNLSNWAFLRTNYHFAVFRPAEGTDKKEVTWAEYKNCIIKLPLTYGEYNPEIKRYEAVLDIEGIEAGKCRGHKIDKRVFLMFGLGELDKTRKDADGRSTYGDTFTQVKRNGRAYAGPKFWCEGLVSSYDANNYKIFRYADAVLMMAECYFRKGEFETGESYLNQTRERAGVDDITGLNADNFLTEIMNERARELAGELHRKYDLVRWGVWYDQTLKWTRNSTGLKDKIRPCHEYYPIPDTECALTGYILDNPAYEDIETETGDE